MGHTLAPRLSPGDAHSIWIDPARGELIGVAEWRIAGKAGKMTGY
jgi:hypothetical protein